MRPHNAFRGVILLFAALPLAAQTPAPPGDPAALWQQLSQPVIDRAGPVEALVIQRDIAKLTLTGTLGFGAPANGRVLQAAFKGQGRLNYAPRFAIEQQQLQLLSGAPAVNVEFSEAVFFFSDKTFDEVSSQAKFVGGDAGLAALYAERVKKLVYYGLNWEPRLLKAALAADPAPHAFFHAQLKTDKFGWLFLTWDRTEVEELSLQRFMEEGPSLETWSSMPAGGRSHIEANRNPAARDLEKFSSYALEAQLEKDTEMSVTAELTWTPLTDGERVLLLSLVPNLRVSEATDGAGNRLAFFQPEDPKERFNYFGIPLTVALAEAPPRRQEQKLRLRYSGKRMVRQEGAGVYYAASFGWYPTRSLGSDDFVHRHHFDLTLRVPKKFDAVAVGNKIEEVKEGDYWVTRWVTDDLPVAVCGFAFGEYYIDEKKLGETTVYTYVNKHDDRFIAELKRQLGTIGADTGIALVEESNPRADDVIGGRGVGSTSVNPRTAVLESLNPASMRRVILQEVSNSLGLFQGYFGKYPYKKLAVSNIPVTFGFGQGWPGLLWVSGLTFLDGTQRHVLLGGMSAREQTNITDRFRAHETSHQWWGHAVGWKSYHDQWLSEGFAEFSGFLYTQLRSGQEEYLEALRADKEPLINKDAFGLVVDQTGPIYLGFRLNSRKHPAYAPITYNKGGWVLHMLRMMMQDFNQKELLQRDARFIRMMRDFVQTYWNQAASTEDFQRIVEKHMNPEMDLTGDRRMDWFFQQWVYSTGIPTYTLRYSLDKQPDGGWKLSGVLNQSGVPAGFGMPVPLYLHYGKDVRGVRGLVAVNGDNPFEIPLDKKPDKVTLNEWEDILAIVKHVK